MIRPLALLLLAGVSSLVGGEAHRRTEKGNALYERGAHPEALDEYGKAQAVAPTAPQLPYDIGNVLYRQKNYAGAAEAYERALGSAPPDLAPHIAYNLGNALYRDERYDDAVKAYVRALKGAPQDADAKRNLELALRALEIQKQKKQQNPQQQQKEQKQEPQGGKDQKKPSGDPNQKQPPQPNDDGSDSKPNPNDSKDKSNEQPRQGGMSPEEAKQLLDRVAGQERDDKKKGRAHPAVRSDNSREKDW
jgi:Ca-activated chloride channel family protein